MVCEMGLALQRDFSREGKVQLQGVGSARDVLEVFCKLLQR